MSIFITLKPTKEASSLSNTYKEATQIRNKQKT